MIRLSKLIESAKERILARVNDGLEFKDYDVISKIETENNEYYYNGFRDYHGPNGRSMSPDAANKN